MTHRYALTDAQWERIKDLLPGRAGHVGAPAKNNRLFVDAVLNPTSFHLTPGQASDLDGADVLLKDIQAQTVIADKGYDAQQRVVEPLLNSGKAVVIPSISTRKEQRQYDKYLYKARHLIENFFARLKQYRAIATRYDKSAAAFLEAIHLAAAVIWFI
jgi:transposase